MMNSDYESMSPFADKVLKADGSITTLDGVIIQSANEYWAEVYKQMSPKALKYLHSDGRIDENSGKGSDGIEDVLVNGSSVVSDKKAVINAIVGADDGLSVSVSTILIGNVIKNVEPTVRFLYTPT